MWRRKKEKRKKEDLKNEERKKEKKEDLKNEERRKKRKEEYVGVGGKESVCRKLQEIIIIIIILGVTYSRILKKQKHSNRLAIAAFLKSAAIGPPKKEVYLGSFRIFGWCYL